MRYIVLYMLIAWLNTPVLAHAEIYKWKDKNGAIRYSDVPPPSNVPHESLGKRAGKTPAPVEAPAPSTPTSPPSTQKQSPNNNETDAGQRQDEAEDAKRKAQAAEEELQAKQQNCSTAKANLENYKQGGRVYKMNEQGEREYMGDAELAAAIDNAQGEVDKYCQ